MTDTIALLQMQLLDLHKTIRDMSTEIKEVRKENNEIKENLFQKTSKINEMCDKFNSLLEHFTVFKNFSKNEISEIKKEIDTMKTEIQSSKPEIQSSKPISKKRESETNEQEEIIERLKKGKNMADSWVKGMSKYTSINFNKTSKKWTLQSSIFGEVKFFDTNKEAEKHFESILEEKEIPFEYITRKNYDSKLDMNANILLNLAQ